MIALLALVCSAPPLTPAQQQRAGPIVEVVRNEADAVVAIAATHVVTESQSMFDVFDVPRAVERSSIGSGSVIHEAGYVLTNAHVVAQASELSVVLRGGRELTAHVVAALPSEDLAIVKADVPRGVELQPVTLGESDDLLVGETVVAIGAPVGLQNTVTAGIVSALDRSINPARGVAFKGLIQTDAAINPGNSGGPLFNVVGAQIGVATAIRGDAQNVGFAIPVGKVRAMLPKLLSVESRGRARLGLVLARERPVDGGVIIERVEAGSPAHKAGLEAGMVLIEVDGAETPGLADALVELLEQPTGRPFTIRAVLPEGTIDTFSVAIVEPPPPDGRVLAKRQLGLDVAELDAAAATRLGLRAGAGVVVKDVERGGPAARVGIMPGDLITRVGPYGVRRLADLGVLEGAASGTEVGLRVVRIGRARVLQTEVVLIAR
ncbi:MAG: trypsin-like peptidase domain-containing protein [Deltaproteobacteria bacterium]|nr:trypsin-like peptidase domain-containing protein [Deltaproteobacteria bacterium]